jgi:hypothetical protein
MKQSTKKVQALAKAKADYEVAQDKEFDHYDRMGVIETKIALLERELSAEATKYNKAVRVTDRAEKKLNALSPLGRRAGWGKKR